MIIGITGSISSGKTTAAGLFRAYGFEVIDADMLYSKIFRKNRLLKSRIKKEFGTANRDKLKKIVFSNPDKLKKLNKITHPIIISEIKKSISKIRNSKSRDIIIDAPLLIEAKAAKLVDKLIVVKCGEKNQIKRILKKGKHTRQEIKNILKSQMPLREKLKYADFAIDNNRDLGHLKKQVEGIIKKLGCCKKINAEQAK